MVGTRSSPGHNSTPTARTPTGRSPVAPKRVRQPRTRIQLATNQDSSDEDSDVAVSASVIIAANAPALEALATTQTVMATGTTEREEVEIDARRRPTQE
ncbi:hypothetical protein V7S43_018526 [Phytophthora oleae]|uniref:Uncharacterized protein n=1 Tax=Phytophthora oleae TaxID=2107226 RepID=A0ABD3ETN0_9STRA